MNEPAKYRKRPVEVEAVVWDGDSTTANSFIGEDYFEDWEYIEGGQALLIETREGTMRAEIGDWIVKGVMGEFYPVKPDIFKLTYEEVVEA